MTTASFIPRIVCLFIENDTMCTEVHDAFQNLGIPVKTLILPVHDGAWQFDGVRQLADILEFEADGVFFINTFGIDQECHFLRALDMEGIFQACWFIDNPFYFVNQLNQMTSLRNFKLLYWDSWYRHHLENWGFKSLCYLPQATNPRRFHPMELKPKEQATFRKPLTFAGNLDYGVLYLKIQELLKTAPLSQEDLLGILRRICPLSLTQPDMPLWTLIEEDLHASRIMKNELNQEYIFNIARIVEMRLSIARREEMVRALQSSSLSIWGEISDWQQADLGVELLGRVSYFVNMPKVYNGSHINLNLSRYQQRYGTNQRVFDVPACQAFLITDYKKDLEDFFDLGRECITYRNFEELQQQVVFFQDPEKRKTVIQAGFKRVMAEHTYLHRVKQFITWLQGTESCPRREYTSKDCTALVWLGLAALLVHKKDKARSLLQTLEGLETQASLLEPLRRGLQGHT